MRDYLKDFLAEPSTSESLIEQIIRYNNSLDKLPELRLTLEKEGRYTQNVKNKIDALPSSNNQSSALYAILLSIQPFNIRKFERLLLKSDGSIEKLKGQKVFLFLGKSGAGKSTTIQYLAGSLLELITTN